MRVVTGRWKGRSGTVVKRNGSSTMVALHAPHQVVLRDWSGNTFVAPANFVRPAMVVAPATEGVVEDAKDGTD